MNKVDLKPNGAIAQIWSGVTDLHILAISHTLLPNISNVIWGAPSDSYIFCVVSPFAKIDLKSGLPK